MQDTGSLARYAVIVVLLTTAPTLANAYIDPGSGAYMVQALFTIVATMLFYLRHPLRSIKNAWHYLRRAENASTDATQPTDASSSGETEDAR